MSGFDFDSYFTSQFDAHEATARATRSALAGELARLVALCAKSVRQGGKIMFCGNGGSAADAQHLATELTVKLHAERGPIPGLALTVDTSTLTAAANDWSYDDVFSRQVEALGKSGDVLIGISTSGNSPNVLKALEAARRIGVHATGFGGRDGGRMVGLADPLLVVPSADTARIQEMHITLGHLLCGALEQELGLV